MICPASNTAIFGINSLDFWGDDPIVGKRASQDSASMSEGVSHPKNGTKRDEKRCLIGDVP